LAFRLNQDIEFFLSAQHIEKILFQPFSIAYAVDFKLFTLRADHPIRSMNKFELFRLFREKQCPNRRWNEGFEGGNGVGADEAMDAGDEKGHNLFFIV
jgi:hypothetical protein